MISTSNGSGDELEKFPEINDGPLSTTIRAGEPVIDAGLKSLNHYKRKLPPWRYNLRQKLLPLVRLETPYLAWMQDSMRSPALDSYFAITANLGTHTFFMTALPILFWCGHTSLGRGMVHILASGVLFTGFIKDMFSLPRPLSPPLQRITMSGSAALEYGFPSTHSANAVSVAVYALFTLHSPGCTLQPATRLGLELLAYCYAFSIVLGRLYCGMHGFLDVIVGSIIGALISIVECVYGPVLDSYLHGSSWHIPMAFVVLIIILVRIHPEPADDCPCFDDSVAFAGVVIGIEMGVWHYAAGEWAWDHPVPGTVPFDLKYMGWPIAISRVVVGVLLIFAWRGVMKPTLLRCLPHLFRMIEKSGFILPRKFFMPASEYQKIPAHSKLDNVLPSVSDLPSLLTSIRHPGRGRSVSIGPQSAADAYETLAYRNKRRRESLESGAISPVPATLRSSSKEKDGYFAGTKSTRNEPAQAHVAEVSPTTELNGVGNLPTTAQSKIGSYEQMMGQGQVLFRSASPGGISEDIGEDDGMDMFLGTENDLGEIEMFSRLEKPRVRYDVEVVTKLVVYAGIAWLAVEGNPMIFECIGLGMGDHPRPLR